MPNKRSKSKNNRKQMLNNKWKNPGKSNASTNPDRVLPGKKGNNSFFRSKVKSKNYFNKRPQSNF